MTHIVHSLSRIGLLPNSSPENRRLAVDLVELILTWEKQRLDAVRPVPASTGTSSPESDNRSSRKHDGTFRPFMDRCYDPALVLVGFLFFFLICMLAVRRDVLTRDGTG